MCVFGESLMVKHIFQFNMKTMGLEHQSKHRPHQKIAFNAKRNKTIVNFVLKFFRLIFFFD